MSPEEMAEFEKVNADMLDKVLPMIEAEGSATVAMLDAAKVDKTTTGITIPQFNNPGEYDYFRSGLKPGDRQAEVMHALTFVEYRCFVAGLKVWYADHKWAASEVPVPRELFEEYVEMKESDTDVQPGEAQ
jgi:hypothetical protein